MKTQDRILTYNKICEHVKCEYNADLVPVDELEHIGFFMAPASVRFHGSYEGGLFDHSRVTMNILVDLTEQLGLKWERPESPFIIGLFHDLCKVDAYRCDSSLHEIVHNPNQYIDGHGEKSVIMLQKYLKLTDEEIACIRWHMGAFEKDTKKWEYYGRAIEKYPNVLYTHTADMIASSIKGV